MAGDIRTEHLRILNNLARGIDPATGEPLPDNTTYHSQDVVRALLWVIAEIKEHAPRTDPIPPRSDDTTMRKRKRDNPPRSGLPWSHEECDMLKILFSEGRDIAAIAKGHGRSELACVTRLVAIDAIPKTHEWCVKLGAFQAERGSLSRPSPSSWFAPKTKDS